MCLNRIQGSTLRTHVYLLILKSRAVDPDSSNPDTNPDPAFQVNPDTDPDPGFWWPKTAEKKYSWNFFFFFDPKLQFTCSYATIKYLQATGEAFSSQKRTYSTSKNEIYYLFPMFLGHFCPSGSGSGLQIRIRIQKTHWILIQSGCGSGSITLF